MRRLLLTLLVLSTPAARAADATPAPATLPTPTAATPLNPNDPEARLAQDLAKNLTVGTAMGRAVELQAGDRTVFGIYLPATGEPRGAVVLLHDLGAHADWPGLIGSLRRTLADQGWSTLAVQLPLAGKPPLSAQMIPFLDQAATRIDAALAFLKNEKAPKVALIGHGLGALAALEYGSAHADRVQALVLVGLPHFRNADPRLAAGDALARVKLPMLDLYGTEDRLEVVTTAELRRKAANRMDNYLQLAITGAGHELQGSETMIAARVRGWLDRHTGGGAAATPRQQ